MLNKIPVNICPKTIKRAYNKNNQSNTLENFLKKVYNFLRKPKIMSLFCRLYCNSVPREAIIFYRHARASGKWGRVGGKQRDIDALYPRERTKNRFKGEICLFVWTR